jgi:hypothetical protein
MQNAGHARSHTKQVNIRFTPKEKQALEEAAQRSGLNLSTWARETLLEALETSPSRLALLFQATVFEANRLTVMALQEGKDLSSEAVRDRIEAQALAAAGEVCGRWLHLFREQKEAA